MKKLSLNRIKTIFVISLFFWPSMLSISVAQAQTGSLGCCTITCDGVPHSTSESETDCPLTVSRGEGKSDCTGVFYPNQQAAIPNGEKCIDSSIDSSNSLGASLPKFSNPLDNPKLAVSIPGFLKFRNIYCEAVGKGQICSIPWLADYISALYRYGIGSLIIFAVIVMMIGGVVWLTAGGNESKITDAKKWISGSLFGILIAVSSYMILNIVNPALTNLSPIKISSVDREDLPDYTDYAGLIEEEKNGETLKDNFKKAPKNISYIEVDTLSGKRKIQVDETIVEQTKKAFTDMKNAGFNVKEISDYRPDGNPKKSCHVHGLAIDINASSNYCVDCWKTKGMKVGNFYRPANNPGAGKDYTASDLSMTEKTIVQIWKNAGWCWGGDWKSFKDYMHFSAPSCRNGVECGAPGKFDFSKSVKDNHSKLGVTYP